MHPSCPRTLADDAGAQLAHSWRTHKATTDIAIVSKTPPLRLDLLQVLLPGSPGSRCVKSWRCTGTLPLSWRSVERQHRAALMMVAEVQLQPTETLAIRLVQDRQPYIFRTSSTGIMTAAAADRWTVG